MADRYSQRDTKLRDVLTELSMGRLTVDEAYAQIDGLERPAAGPPKTPPNSFVAGLLVLLFGAIFSGVGGFFAYKSLGFSHDAEHVEGTVIRHERSGNKGNRVPVVRYEVAGKPYEIRGEIASNMPAAVHSKVNVIYKTADPAQAQIDSFVQRWLFPLIFGGVGGLVDLVGLTLIIRAIAAKFRSATVASERFTV